MNSWCRKLLSASVFSVLFRASFILKLSTFILVASSVLACGSAGESFPSVEGCRTEPKYITGLDFNKKLYGLTLHCYQVDHLYEAKTIEKLTGIYIEESANIQNFDFSGFEELVTLNINNSKIETLDLSSVLTLKYLTLSTGNLATLELPSQLSELSLKNMDSLSSVVTQGLNLYKMVIEGKIYLGFSDVVAKSGVRILTIDSPDIGVQAISNLDSLTSLTIVNFATESLDLNHAPNLQKLFIDKIEMPSLTIVSSNTNVEVRVSNSIFDVINLSMVPNLEKLSIYASTMAMLNLEANVVLEDLRLTRVSGFSSLNLSGNEVLSKVAISGTDLASLDLSDTEVVRVELLSTKISQLALPEGREDEGYLRISFHKTKDLVVNGGGQWRQLRFVGNQGFTESLLIEDLRLLKMLILEGVNMETLDLEHLTNLNSMTIYSSVINTIIYPPNFYDGQSSLDDETVRCRKLFVEKDNGPDNTKCDFT